MFRNGKAPAYSRSIVHATIGSLAIILRHGPTCATHVGSVCVEGGIEAGVPVPVYQWGRLLTLLREQGVHAQLGLRDVPVAGGAGERPYLGASCKYRTALSTIRSRLLKSRGVPSASSGCDGEAVAGVDAGARPPGGRGSPPTEEARHVQPQYRPAGSIGGGGGASPSRSRGSGAATGAAAAAVGGGAAATATSTVAAKGAVVFYVHVKESPPTQADRGGETQREPALNIFPSSGGDHGPVWGVVDARLKNASSSIELSLEVDARPITPNDSARIVANRC